MSTTHNDGQMRQEILWEQGKTKGLVPYAYVTTFAASQNQHGASLNDDRQPPCSLKKDKNSMSGLLLPFHAEWDECNKQVRHQPKQAPIDTRLKKKKRETRRGSDLRERRLRSHDSASLQGVYSACWVHCCLIQHWHHLHIPAPPICQFARSPAGENILSTPEAWRVTGTAALKGVNVKSFKLLPASHGGTLHGRFPGHSSDTEIWYRAPYMSVLSQMLVVCLHVVNKHHTLTQGQSRWLS